MVQDVGISPRSFGFDPGQINVEFVVGKKIVVLENIYVRELRLSLTAVITLTFQPCNT